MPCACQVPVINASLSPAPPGLPLSVQENLRQLCVFKLAKEAGRPYLWCACWARLFALLFVRPFVQQRCSSTDVRRTCGVHAGPCLQHMPLCLASAVVARAVPTTVAPLLDAAARAHVRPCMPVPPGRPRRSDALLRPLSPAYKCTAGGTT